MLGMRWLWATSQGHSMMLPTDRCTAIVREVDDSRSEICGRPATECYRSTGVVSMLHFMCDEHFSIVEADSLYWRHQVAKQKAAYDAHPIVSIGRFLKKAFR